MSWEMLKTCQDSKMVVSSIFLKLHDQSWEGKSSNDGKNWNCFEGNISDVCCGRVF